MIGESRLFKQLTRRLLERAMRTELVEHLGYASPHPQEAQMRAINAGHPEWLNACATCGTEIFNTDATICEKCL